MRIRQAVLFAALILLAGTVFAAPPPDPPKMSLTHPNVFMVPQVSSPPIQFQNAGTPIGIAFTFNCSTGLTCTLTNGVIVATAGSGGTITSCGTSNALAYYSAATTLNCDGSITTNASGALTAATYNATTAASAYAISGQVYLKIPVTDAGFTTTALGSGAAGATNTANAQVTAIGKGTCASETNSVGNGCTAVGINTLNAETGAHAAAFGDNSCTTATGNNVTCVGGGTAVSAAADTNETVLGQGVTGAGSNTATIGNGSVTDEFIGSSSATAIQHSGNLAMVTGSDYTNATAGATNVTGLSFPLLASKKYAVSCKLIYQGSATTTTMTLTSTGPASPTKVTGQTIMDTTSGSGAAFFSGAFDGTTFGFSAGPPSAIVTTATDLYSTLDVGIVNGANAGTWQLQATNGTGTLTIRVGSFCMLNAQ